MKPLGPIPQGFTEIGGVLAIDRVPVSHIVDEAGSTPLFVYSGRLMRERVALLRSVLPSRIDIHYAVKANPYLPVINVMSELVDGFDIASGGELARVIEAGVDPRLLSFAGPGKRDAELEAAIKVGVTLNLESEAEADRALFDSILRLGCPQASATSSEQHHSGGDGHAYQAGQRGFKHFGNTSS